MEITINNQKTMSSWGEKLGARLKAGDVIELVGDVGAGKTTLTKAIMRGAGVDSVVGSPSFTINQTYQGNGGLILNHYDLYRLDQAGLISDQVKEELALADGVIILEWAGAVQAILPTDRLTIEFKLISDSGRQLKLTSGGASSQKLLEEIQAI